MKLNPELLEQAAQNFSNRPYKEMSDDPNEPQALRLEAIVDCPTLRRIIQEGIDTYKQGEITIEHAMIGAVHIGVEVALEMGKIVMEENSHAV
jgi:hypothetical protein